MKNKKIHFLFYLILLSFSFLSGQTKTGCDLIKQLNGDLGANAKLISFLEDPAQKNAYDLLKNASDDFRRNEDNIKKLVDDLASSPGFETVFNTIGGGKAWEILINTPFALRTNADNLQKLSRYIEDEGVDIAKLKSSLANTKDFQKWIDLKLPKADLDNIYAGIKNDPPFDLTPWTPEHKAQRWKNYEEGCLTGQNSCQEFETWSNGYDGKIDLVTNANQSVNNYFNSLGWNCPASNCREQTLQVVLNGQIVNRRLDIYNAFTGEAREFKEYAGGTVYKSEDIVNEVLRDKALIADGRLSNMEWVFKGCAPSGPLKSLLESTPNKITIITIP